MRWLMALVVCATLLAGCSDGAPAEAPADDFDLDEDLKADKDTGIIRGVVVDQAIVPLAGVKVLVQGLDETKLTDAQGQFGFGGLEPGTYQVRAQKAGFTPETTTVQVVAGEDQPPVARLLLKAIPGYNPYSSLITHDGFYQCGTSRAVVCGAPGALLPFFGMEDPVGIDSSTHTFYFEGYPQFIQSEMDWVSTQTLSPGLSFEMEALDEGCTEYSSEELLAGEATIGQASGESPIRVRADNASLEKQNINPNDCGIYYSVFASGAQGTDVGFSVEQDFTWFITSFYGYEPPEEWWFVEAGEYPPPA